MLLAACAALPPTAKEFASFSDYAESVFRRQNALSSRLMMLNETDQIPDDDQLEGDEQAMHDACHLLNEYAEMEISGEFINPLFASSVQGSIETCEQRIATLESRLNRLLAP